MPDAALLIRPSREADLGAISRIYGHAVAHGTGTFEIEPPGQAEMVRRRADLLALGLPWLVAERGAAVLGYACAGVFRPRPAYRHCVEDSIYLDASARGHGVGRLLLAELLARCEAWGARQVLAVIGDSANAGSIGAARRYSEAPYPQRCRNSSMAATASSLFPLARARLVTPSRAKNRRPSASPVSAVSACRSAR